ncbi:cuticle protein 10.9 [Trichonephila clavipes]|nr:cuticle protein 10.9 [Trichonephila clavipes]
MTFWEYTSTGLAADGACPLCGHVRMDGDHLLQCTELDEYSADDIVSRYWEARCQMVKKASTGVGLINSNITIFECLSATSMCDVDKRPNQS